MFELPGMTNSGDDKQDLDSIRRYLSRLVPQLEMELMSAREDSYQDELMRQRTGMGGSNPNGTAGALAEHVLRKDNPHGVTLAQLGFSLDKAVAVEFTQHGMTARIGDKHGVQLEVQTVDANVQQWRLDSGTIVYAVMALGDWDRPFERIFGARAGISAANTNDVWLSGLTGSGSAAMGTVRLYHTTDSTPDEHGVIMLSRQLKINVIGVGVFGYESE